jgi:HEPN domain
MLNSTSVATNQLHVLLASGQALLERVDVAELDPREVMAAYQQWYTPTLALLDVLMPERRLEFESYYRRPDGTVSPTPGIADILASPPIVGERKAGLAEIFDPAAPRLIFLHLFGLQLAILGSAQTLLPVGLGRLESIVAAGLLDAELAAAAELLAGGRRRAAAVLAGVVVERQLAALARREGLPVAAHTSITKLARALRKAGLLDGAPYREARRLARLADRYRTAKRPAPSRKQVRRLIARAREMVRETL